MKYTRNDDKNNYLKHSRGIGFENVIQAIDNWTPYIIVPNDTHWYNHQYMILIFINNYPYKIPYIQREYVRHLITIYPSRKYKDLFFNSQDE